MVPSSLPRIADVFADVVDPRIDRTRRHTLLDIISIAVCAVVCGAESWVDVELWGKSKQSWLEEWLALPNGIPSHNTFGRVFARIDPDQFAAGFFRWSQEIVAHAPQEVIAIDGKTVRGSADRVAGHRPLHLLSAWATTHRLVLCQEAMNDTANEITTLPRILDQVILQDQIITIDAMGCQREIAAQIVEGGGDYVLAVKANQEALLEDIVDCFTVTPSPESDQQVEKNHGRMERWVCETITDPEVVAWLNPDGTWPQLRSIARITATRQPRGEPATTAIRYYISSLPGDARQIATVVRSHLGDREPFALGSGHGIPRG